MDRRTYTALEIASSLGCSKMSVSRRSRSEAWKFSKRAGRGGGKIYSYCDLPEDVQAAITLHEAQRQPAKCTFDENKPIPDSRIKPGLPGSNCTRIGCNTALNKNPNPKQMRHFSPHTTWGILTRKSMKHSEKPAARVCSAGIGNCGITAEITAAFAITGDGRRLKMYRAISAPRRRKPSSPST